MSGGPPRRRPVRPAPAAGLVLLRGSGPESEVLLGRRNPDMRFMPNVYVFPGGRLEPRDRTPSGFAEPVPAPAAGLDRFTRRHLAALARTALRETFEESGLLLGGGSQAAAPTPQGRPSLAAVAEEPWRSYREFGLQPAFGGLHLVARAITPTGSPIRFHSRFFCAEGDQTRGRLGGNGELLDIAWVPLTEIRRLPMSGVTALILGQALAHRTASQQGAAPAPALFRWVGDRRHGGRYAVEPGPAKPRWSASQGARQQA